MGRGGDGYLIGDGGCLTREAILVPLGHTKLGGGLSALPTCEPHAWRSGRGAGRLAGTGWCCEPSPDLLRELPRAPLGALEDGWELGVDVLTERLYCCCPVLGISSKFASRWCDEGVELAAGGLSERLRLDRLPRRDLGASPCLCPTLASVVRGVVRPAHP